MWGLRFFRPDISVAPTSQQERKKNFFLSLQVKSPEHVAASVASVRGRCRRIFFLIQQGASGISELVRRSPFQRNGAAADQSGDPDISVAPTSAATEKFFLPLQVKSPGLVAVVSPASRKMVMLMVDHRREATPAVENGGQDT